MAAIPAFNEADFIEAIVSKASRYVDEVIVVDDGSTDDTSLVAKKAGAIVIRHEANSGVGQANKTCFELARSQAIDVLVTIDGDGQHNPDEIPRLLMPSTFYITKHITHSLRNCQLPGNFPRTSRSSYTTAWAANRGMLLSELVERETGLEPATTCLEGIWL